MSKDTSKPNAFLTAPLGAIFLKTALPIIFVMSMNGLLTVVDAVMLGIYVGAEAVGAVTTVFPIFILTGRRVIIDAGNSLGSFCHCFFV